MNSTLQLKKEAIERELKEAREIAKRKDLSATERADLQARVERIERMKEEYKRDEEIADALGDLPRVGDEGPGAVAPTAVGLAGAFGRALTDAKFHPKEKPSVIVPGAKALGFQSKASSFPAVGDLAPMPSVLVPLG